jgi:hypothetical protein
MLVWFLQISTSFAVEKQAIGWLENVKINGGELELKAKIDTGATTTSINAKKIKKFKKNGDEWIRFRVENKEGEKVTLEKKITRYVSIKRKLALSIKRPVVNLGICIGNVYRELEVNLADRSNFVYRVLIGRNYLRDYFLVDSAQKYTVTPSCTLKK